MTIEFTNDGVCCGRGEAVEGCHGEEEGKRMLVIYVTLYTTILSLLIHTAYMDKVIILNLQAVLL